MSVIIVLIWLCVGVGYIYDVLLYTLLKLLVETASALPPCRLSNISDNTLSEIKIPDTRLTLINLSADTI